MQLGQPIDVRAPDTFGGRLRHVGTALTAELETQIQSLLDAIGPGRPITPPTSPAAPAAAQFQSSSA